MTRKKFDYEMYDRYDCLMDAHDFDCTVEVLFEDNSHVEFMWAQKPTIDDEYFIIFTEHNDWHRFPWKSVKSYRVRKHEDNVEPEWIKGGYDEQQ